MQGQKERPRIVQVRTNTTAGAGGLAGLELGQPPGGSGLFAGDGVFVQGAGEGNSVEIAGELAKLKLSLIAVRL